VSFGKESVNINSAITIEHIMPQNSNNIEWQKEIGRDYYEVYNKYLHTLGNLTLTGFNSELSDKNFNDKKALLLTNSKFAYLNSNIVNKKTWNEKTIVERAQQLAQKLIKEFRLPTILAEVAMNTNKENKHTVFDGTNFTNTKPASFIFLSEKIDVSSYREMLLKICEMFYSLDTVKMCGLAHSNYSLKKASKFSLSYDQEILRTPLEIFDSGIFVETNLNSNSAIRLIRGLIDEFDLSYDDLIFYTLNK